MRMTSVLSLGAAALLAAARTAPAQVTITGTVSDSATSELARTRSLDYSIFTLEALMQLAELGRAVGVDLWGYESPRGGSIRKALDYLAPYADSLRRWPGPQITPVSPTRLLLVLRLGELAYGDARYGALIASIPPQLTPTHRLQLLYPPPARPGS